MLFMGVINVLKPTGWTSSDVVVKVKHLLKNYTGNKKIKVGHLGTLDPAGSGVLPICFGSATRLFDYMVGQDKVYRATFCFGKTTDTLDSYGVVVGECKNIPTLDEITSKIGMFLGKIMQLPPKYSRISVGGIRACDAARDGKEIDIKPRQVNVYNINILSYDDGVLTLDIHCSGGTYIRSICRDLAVAVDSIAYMSSIIRLQNKNFFIENAVTLDELKDNIEKHIISLEDLFSDMPKVYVQGKESFQLLNGVKIANRGIKTDYIVVIDGKIFGICKDGDKNLEVVVRLWN